MKTEVHFRSTVFNATTPKDYFLNECCFGDDVCEWLISELRGRGYQTDETPGQEDFGWYFYFTVDGVRHCFLAAFQPNDPSVGDQWLGFLERDRGFLATIVGGRHRNILQAAVMAIDTALRSSSKVSDVSWQ